ncbi:MAG TPA: hypothetical protein VJZ74_03855, partial [Pseudolabrys sp.]|nr:hypothetical protein [Pseudolabrys sp.]
MPGLSGGGAANRSDREMLRAIVIAAGIGWSVLFVVVGLGYQLQLYGDGAMFSYSVAVQDVWAFHWHNISGRLAVYLFSLAPAEAFVAMTGNPAGGIVVYGLLFFVAPLLGLIATFAADRSAGRIIFDFACCSTAALSPLVFGSPTEMWVAHALFWPALAVGHYARRGLVGTALVFATLLALVLSHEGAFVLAVAIVATLAVRGMHDAAFWRAAGALLAAIAIWAAVKTKFPPDDYFAGVYVRAALGFLDVAILRSGLVLLLFGAIAGYGIACRILARIAPARAPIYAAVVVAAALALYWLWFDHVLHADNRYYMRTALVIATPLFGVPAALRALNADGRLTPLFLTRVVAITHRVSARALAGAFLLVMLVHAVETAKFVAAWTNYKAAVLALAMGAASDPALGDPHFVSSDRIGAELNRLSW